MTREEAVKKAIEDFEWAIHADNRSDISLMDMRMAIAALREQGGSFQNGNNHNEGKDWPSYMDLPRERETVTNRNGLNRWISVKERLPEKKGQYLVYTKWTYGNFICLCNWTPKYNGWEEHLNGRAIWYNYDSEYGDYECKDITHWMPLPEGPGVEV